MKPTQRDKDASYFTEKSTHKQTEYHRHLNKLEEIYTKDCYGKVRSVSGLKSIQNFTEIKKLHANYSKSKKETMIFQENEKIFQKLKHIGGGNYKSGVPRNQPFYKKSLLADKKRLEDIRRNEENYRMRVRLGKITSVPSIARERLLMNQDKLLEKQHQIHQQNVEVLCGSRGRLPPILSQRHKDQLEKDADTVQYLNQGLGYGKSMGGRMSQDDQSVRSNSVYEVRSRSPPTGYGNNSNIEMGRTNEDRSTYKGYQSEVELDKSEHNKTHPNNANRSTFETRNHNTSTAGLKPGKSTDKLDKSQGSTKHNKSAHSNGSKVDKEKSIDKSDAKLEESDPNPQRSTDLDKSKSGENLIKEDPQEHENLDDGDADSETRRVEAEIKELEEEERQMELENARREQESEAKRVENERAEAERLEKERAEQYAIDQENNKDLFDSGFSGKEPQKDAPKNDSKFLESDVYNESDIFGDSKKPDADVLDDDEFGV